MPREYKINKQKAIATLNMHCPEWDSSWTWDIVKNQLNKNNFYLDSIECLEDEVDRLESVIATLRRFKSDICEEEVGQ